MVLDCSTNFKMDDLFLGDYFHWKCFLHGPVRDLAQPTHKENFLQVSVLGGKLVLKSKTWENTY